MARVQVTKINFKPMVRDFSKTRAFKNEARKIANKRFQKAKNNLINGFDSHPITREIEGGAEASNTSGTLGGDGNLFTFIGFYREDNPVEKVRSALREKIRITSGRIATNKNVASAEFTVSAPTIADLSSITPMPWEGGSWIKAIESGISGFGYYMFKRNEASRSGHGLQIDRKVRNGGYRPVKYYSDLFRKFRKEVIVGL
jgi:hypothetical protein